MKEEDYMKREKPSSKAKKKKKKKRRESLKGKRSCIEIKPKETTQSKFKNRMQFQFFVSLDFPSILLHALHKLYGT